jgi:NAD(P)-dependent dehydrogenase (short-subunit alcohol dehydrogenase family)
MKGLEGKVALIAGGGTGIGAATARRLVEGGALVVIGDINIEAATTLAAELGSRAKAVHYDASDASSVAALVDQGAAAFGRLNVLFNNTAITLPEVHQQDLDIIEIPIETWNRIFAVNVTSFLLAIKHAVPYLRAAGGGSIINTSSGSAQIGDLVRTGYSMSKAAINSLTLNAAVQYGRDNIRCNAVAPGLIQTRQSTLADLIKPHLLTPRLGLATDIASLVAFLASNESEYMTGQIIACDGGHFAHGPHMVDVMRMEEQLGGRLKPMTRDQIRPLDAA